ncbi:hypothetical protein [Streptomyces sp. NPDC003374]
MHTPHPPHPPRPPHPPHPGTPPGESDRSLVARLRDTDDGHHAVALLLARHWRATYDYAVICLSAPGSSAAMVTTAAYRRVLRRMGGTAAGGGTLRPQLLVAAREIVRQWAADEAACVVLPELRRPGGGRGLRAVNSMIPERRLLAERAFHALPGAFQCLLWHCEVEAEPISVPAGLLAIDAEDAAAALRQAREQFRAGCIRAHRELAPARECRYYNRLLEVPTRRGVPPLPDVQRHLRACAHCRYAAEQLGRFDADPGLLLAESVLGWGARRYLDSRPGRAAAGRDSRAAGPGRPGRAGRHRDAPARPDALSGREAGSGRDALSGRDDREHGDRTGRREDPGRRYRTAVVLGVGLASLGLLATALAVRSWADDGAPLGPGAVWGSGGGARVHPSAARVPCATGPAGHRKEPHRPGT